MTRGGTVDSTSPGMNRTISPSLFGKGARARPTPGFGSNDRLVALVGDQLDRADKAEPARLADQRMSPSALSRA